MCVGWEDGKGADRIQHIYLRERQEGREDMALMQEV